MITWNLDDYDVTVLRGHLQRLAEDCDVTQLGDLRRLIFSLDEAVKPSDGSLFCYFDTNKQPRSSMFMATYRVGTELPRHVYNVDSKHSEYHGLNALLKALIKRADQHENLPRDIVAYSDCLNLVRQITRGNVPKNSHSHLYLDAAAYLDILRDTGHQVRLIYMERNRINAALRLPT